MMSRQFSKFIQLGIIGIWLCLVAVLLYRHYISGSDFSSLQSISEDQFRTSEEWFSVYVQNKKIGHLRTKSEKIGDEYRFVQTGETEVQQDGKTVKNTSSFTCLTDTEYRMKSFQFETRSGAASFKSSGEVDENNVLLVFVEENGQRKTESRHLEGKPYLAATIKQMLSTAGIDRGQRIRIPVLDIFSLNVDDVLVEVQDLIPVKTGINVGTVYLLKIGNNLSWVSETGWTFKEKHASGLVYYSAPEPSAKSKGFHYTFDFLSVPVLKSNKLLASPEDLFSARIKISGVNPSDYPLLNGGRQVVKDGHVEITRENVEMLQSSSYALPYSGGGLDAFMAPTEFVQSDHHTIQYNAKKFVAIEKNAFRLARFLTSNLYLTMKKIPFSRLNTSMDVFNIPVGESNEHAVLFTAFARASGMPTRMVGGLVYRKGHFYYHAWPEVWLGRWIAADPTMGQFPADVTHIRFLEGDIDKIASFGAQMKDIKVEIMETQ